MGIKLTPNSRGILFCKQLLALQVLKPKTHSADTLWALGKVAICHRVVLHCLNVACPNMTQSTHQIWQLRLLWQCQGADNWGTVQ